MSYIYIARVCPLMAKSGVACGVFSPLHAPRLPLSKAPRRGRRLVSWLTTRVFFLVRKDKRCCRSYYSPRPSIHSRGARALADTRRDGTPSTNHRFYPPTPSAHAGAQPTQTGASDASSLSLVLSTRRTNRSKIHALLRYVEKKRARPRARRRVNNPFTRRALTLSLSNRSPSSLPRASG